MKKVLIIFLWFANLAPLLAQAPLGFNYQGIARQSDGAPIANQTIGIRVSITEGSEGQSQFTEEHFPETNEFGLFTLVVGQGNGGGTLNSVDWSGGNLWLQIELDPDNMGDYILMGSQQLMSVPYALYSQQSGGGLSPGYGIDITNGVISNVLPPVTVSGGENITVTGSYPNYIISSASASADADADPTNEIQDLQLAGNSLTITKNGSATTIDLSAYLDNTDTQLTEEEVDTYVDNNGYLITEVDGSISNEIQDLQLVGNNLTITNNGSATTIDLTPYLDDTDTHLTEAEVDAYANDNGYLTSEVDGSTTNELQNLSSTPSGTNRTINISGGTGTTISVADNDNSSSNEIQDLASVLAQGADANNTVIANVADPVNSQDAVNLQYLEQKDATDYAISAALSHSSLGVGDVTLDLSGASLDKGGLISGSTITITEAGVYAVSVQGYSNLAAGSSIDIEINGAPTTILKGGNVYLGNYLFDLLQNDTIEIIVRFGAAETINLQLSVYKI